LRTGVGANRREFRNMVAPEPQRLRSDRSTTGASVGNIRMPDFRSLVGLEEQKHSIYSKSEELMFENTTKVRKLIEQLEKKEADKDET